MKEIIKKLCRDYRINDYDEQVKGFKSLGDYFLKEKRYIDAIAVYNFGLAICMDHKKACHFSTSRSMHINDYIKEIKQTEKEFLSFVKAKKEEPTDWSFDEAHRKTINDCEILSN